MPHPQSAIRRPERAIASGVTQAAIHSPSATSTHHEDAPARLSRSSAPTSPGIAGTCSVGSLRPRRARPPAAARHAPARRVEAVERNGGQQRDTEGDQHTRAGGSRETPAVQSRPCHVKLRSSRFRSGSIVIEAPSTGGASGCWAVDRRGHARLERAQAEHVGRAPARREAAHHDSAEQEQPRRVAERAAQAGRGLEEDGARGGERERGEDHEHERGEVVPRDDRAEPAADELDHDRAGEEDAGHRGEARRSG
jgi:hypothetical protein